MSQERRNKSNEVLIKIGRSTKHITGVTKYTTCGDVISMVLDKTGIGKENCLDSFGIFEASRGVERMLPGKSKLSKVMRSWGTDTDYELVFRKVNPVVYVPKISEAKRRKLTQRCKLSAQVCGTDGSRPERTTSGHSSPMHKSSPICSSEVNNLGSIENNEFVSERYSRESHYRRESFSKNIASSNSLSVHRINDSIEISYRSAFAMDNDLHTSTSPVPSKMVCCADVAVANNVNNVKYAVRKPLKSKTLYTKKDEENAKADTLQYIPTKLTGIKCGTISVKSRDTAHGDSVRCQNEPMKRHIELEHDIETKITMMDQKEGKEAILRKYFADYLLYQSPSYRSRDSYFRNRGDGAESECESGARRRGDGSEYNDNPPLKRLRKRIYTDGSDSGQDEEMSHFDTAFIDEGRNSASEDTASAIDKLVDYSLSEDSDVSDLCDISAIQSSVSDVVKCVFEDQDVVNEDEAMESFMNTMLCSDNSDEGLSSMNSDTAEKEILV